MATTITILHFNDVYNVQQHKEEPVGGAARFVTAIKSFSHLNPLILFSGDIFSPSMCQYNNFSYSINFFILLYTLNFNL